MEAGATRRWRQSWLRGFAVFLFVVAIGWFVIAWGTRMDDNLDWLRVANGALFLAMAIMWWRQSTTLMDADGVVVTTTRRRRVPWSELVDVSVGADRRNPSAVALRLHDGSTIALVGVPRTDLDEVRAQWLTYQQETESGPFSGTGCAASTHVSG